MDLLNFFNGFKTFIGGLILVGGGVAGMAFGVVDPATGAMLVGNGFGLWGIGGKIEKAAQTLAEGQVNAEPKIKKSGK